METKEESLACRQLAEARAAFARGEYATASHRATSAAGNAGWGEHRVNRAARELRQQADAKRALIANPTNNAARAYNAGIRDALAGTYRSPVDRLVGDYNEGWEKVAPLPQN